MKLKADVEINRLGLQDIFPASFQSFLKMTSAKSAHRPINEYCRYIAHQLQTLGKKYRTINFIVTVSLLLW
jgi:hypothetical protein